ncbi:MAG TPA: NAD(+) kinase, partial [Pirellula sp.]|nr:NAD(+) kinase [Pirellula sp.]
DRIFDLKIRVDHPTASVVVDGRVVCHFGRDLRVRISRASDTFQLISIPGHDDYKALREKLGWSGKPRLT